MYTILLNSPGGSQLLRASNRGKAFQQLMNWSGCTLQQATDVLDAVDKGGAAGGSAKCFTVTACSVRVLREPASASAAGAANAVKPANVFGTP